MDYQMGFFHRPRSGRPSLALDLAEELRPLTGRFVVSLIRRRQVGSDSFVEMPGGAVPGVQPVGGSPSRVAGSRPR